MGSKEIKENILQKINQIDDETLLLYIQDFLTASDKYYNKKESKSKSNREGFGEDTIDFTDYIKEWIKDM